LLDADLSDEEACRRRDQLCRDTRDRVEALGDAISEIERKIADVESRLLAARDAAERAELARAVTANADALVAASAGFADASGNVLPLMDALVAKLPGVAADFVPRFRMLMGELPAAVNQLVSDARRHAANVMKGNVPGVRPAPPPPEPPPAAPIERTRIYCLSPLTWREGEQVMCSPRYGWATAPRQIAELALARGLAALPDSDITRRTIEAFGANHAVTAPEMCLDLDGLDQPATEPPAAGQPRTPPMFEERVGPARVGEISVSRA
jgi:hypothetical protein